MVGTLRSKQAISMQQGQLFVPTESMINYVHNHSIWKRKNNVKDAVLQNIFEGQNGIIGKAHDVNIIEDLNVENMQDTEYQEEIVDNKINENIERQYTYVFSTFYFFDLCMIV
ncbi:hypothetical protein TKK_0015572 [Trichogramma kaykai]